MEARRLLLIGRWLPLTAAFAILSGCGRTRLPAEALVFTQTPVTSPSNPGADTVLDERYPPGSRVVLLPSPQDPERLRVLSKGLFAAGSPVISADGTRVLFAGKASARDNWQIYEARLPGGRPRRLTAISGGAMDPAVLGNGAVVFSSPVPPGGATWTTTNPAALYRLNPDRSLLRLTWGPAAAVEPTVLNDGRILFVSAKPRGADGEISLGLFTINNDGTEVAAYALDRDGAPRVHRPRELQDGRVGFLAATPTGFVAEGVQTARPFAGRRALFPFSGASCRSVEPGGAGRVLATLLPSPGTTNRSFAVFELAASATAPGEPLFDDPAWHDLEAMRPGTRPRPLGHLSTMSANKDYGTLLCLNVNFSRHRQADGSPARTATRVRVTALDDQGAQRVLGELPVHPDGSFMAELPADRPLGFESLDADGELIHRLPPTIWVRAGENRSCVGCHEPPNRSPRNVRPKAVYEPVARLRLANPDLASTVP